MIYFLFSGTCKVFDITEDFDHFVNVYNDSTEATKINLIIEIDYMANKYSYEFEKNTKKK